ERLDGVGRVRDPEHAGPPQGARVQLPHGLADGRPAGVDAHALGADPVGALPDRAKRLASRDPPQAGRERLLRHDRRAVRRDDRAERGTPAGDERVDPLLRVRPAVPAADDPPRVPALRQPRRARSGVVVQALRDLGLLLQPSARDDSLAHPRATWAATHSHRPLRRAQTSVYRPAPALPSAFVYVVRPWITATSPRTRMRTSSARRFEIVAGRATNAMKPARSAREQSKPLLRKSSARFSSNQPASERWTDSM